MNWASRSRIEVVSRLKCGSRARFSWNSYFCHFVSFFLFWSWIFDRNWPKTDYWHHWPKIFWLTLWSGLLNFRGNKSFVKFTKGDEDSFLKLLFTWENHQISWHTRKVREKFRLGRWTTAIFLKAQLFLEDQVQKTSIILHLALNSVSLFQVKTSGLAPKIIRDKKINQKSLLNTLQPRENTQN